MGRTESTEAVGTERTCDALRAIGPESALVVVYGEEQPRATAHTERCPTCRGGAAMSRLTYALLELLPLAEPPAGFENRVLSRVGGALPADADRSQGRPSP